MESNAFSGHVAAVVQSSEGSDLFVFKPRKPRPSYNQKNASREEVQWGVSVPQDVPESFTSEAHQWLNRSKFYFLTKSPTGRQLLAEESSPTTPFSLILGKHRQQQDAKLNETSESKLVQIHLMEHIPAINELPHTPAHGLPLSASFLCSLFANSLLLSTKTEGAEEIPDDVDMEGKKKKKVKIQMKKKILWKNK